MPHHTSRELSSNLLRITSDPFGTLADGTSADIITFRNTSGATLRVTPFGATIVSLTTPDRDGHFDDIVLGYDTVAPYETESPYFGAIIGRYANRIARGEFTLDGTAYTLAANNGVNHLHGGKRGFDKVMWMATPFEGPDHTGIRLTYRSAAEEEGYPGTLDIEVTYTFTDDLALHVAYHGTTDAPTLANFTQHSYFNLAGGRREMLASVLAHELTVHADHYTPVDHTLIPTGEYRSVQDTPFDFRHPHTIGERIDAPDEQLRHAGGYDHNFVLAHESSETPQLVATLHEPESGRTIDVLTTEPGMQLYSGNFLDGTIRGKNGQLYGHRSAVCLETQRFPDSPNHPHFPSAVLRPGTPYRSETIYRFGVEPRR
jgi:aldose 1-epimerase